MTVYNEDFYSNRHSRTKYAAKTILSKVIEVHPSITSAIDIGCGVGTWLSVLKQHGVSNVQGVDGPWVEQKLLEIPPECFRSYDFKVPEIDLTFNRRYDLAICLEVAEHIDPPKAKAFVQYLTTLSDLILFSAAIPGQGGIGHVNEQWPSYWVGLFSEHGYVVRDTLRLKIWNDDQIPWWYRQNIMLFLSKEETLCTNSSNVDMSAIPVVHPVLLRAKTEIYTGQAFKIFVDCVLQALRRKLASFSVKS